MNNDKYNIDERPITEQVMGMNAQLRQQRMKEAATKEGGICKEAGVRGVLIDLDEMNAVEVDVGEGYQVGEAPDQSEEIMRRYGGTATLWAQWAYKMSEPTTIISKAIEQVEQMGNYKVMFALVDLDDAKPKEERLYTFCDIESEKLREVIYNEVEKEFETE